MNDQDYADGLRVTMSELTAHFHEPVDIATTLFQVTSAAVELIEGVEYADVLLIDGIDSFQSVASTGRVASDLDDVQRRFGEGPCIDAALDDVVTVSNDLSEETRWPRFAESAVAVGVHGMLSFRLYTHDARMGALNLFAGERDVFSSDVEALAAMLATQAAIALIADDKELQFRSALASRDMIGQAKGMIMERFNVDAMRAFELLKRLSQESNTRLIDIATELVARGSEPVGR
ncbi:GAF and ANTAR domain-containing protein [Mycolicibacterium sp. GCM10028919]|uniref:GAF and ANTAR domain-containing protein n=1 Tax=Mycolicibacterium sp. GCM10028919 TaxID=3273401 RepID=UPI0036222FCF